jgi:hypothetical protein
MRHMEIQHGKEGMKDALYNRQYGATAGCTVHLKIVFLEAREISVMVYELMLGSDQLKQQWK